MKPSERHSQILVVSGPVHGGKTTFVTRLAGFLRERGTDMAGFICRGKFSGGRRRDYTLVDLEEGSEVPFASSGKKAGWSRFRRFYINPEALSKGEMIIRKGIRRGADLVVVDEVGPLELGGGGWSCILELLEKETGTMQIWVAREQAVEDIKMRWDIPGKNIFRLERGNEEALMEMIWRRVAIQKQ